MNEFLLLVCFLLYYSNCQTVEWVYRKKCTYSFFQISFIRLRSVNAVQINCSKMEISDPFTTSVLFYFWKWRFETLLITLKSYFFISTEQSFIQFDVLTLKMTSVLFFWMTNLLFSNFEEKCSVLRKSNQLFQGRKELKWHWVRNLNT